MSAPKFSAYIRKHIIPIIKKDIRDALDTAIQTLEIPKEELIPEMIKHFKGMTSAEANDILNMAIKSLNSKSWCINISKEVGRANVWKTKSTTPTAKKGRTTVDSRYNQFANWKTAFGDKLIKHPEYGHYFSGGNSFGGFLELGHGATPEPGSTTRSTKTLAASEQRRVKAFGKVQEGVTSGKITKAQAAWITGALGEEIGFDKATFKTTFDSIFLPKGNVSRKGTVFLTLQSADRNEAERKAELLFKAKLLDRLVRMAIDAESSPSPMKWIDNHLESSLRHGKHAKGVNSSVKTEDVIKPKAKRKKAKITKPPRLRTAQGRFTSPIALMNLINSRLHDVIRKNMGSPALNYQTGRFAKSAKVGKISQTRQGQMTAFYTYMKSPYQTFERGYAQGSPQRDPRSLISKSIREAAAQIMGSRFEIRTRRQ